MSEPSPNVWFAFPQVPLATDRALKHFLRKHVYYSPTLISERQQSSAQVARLFRFFLENPGEIPPRDGDDPIHRIVCDYIAGMTDGYFRRVYAQYLGA